MLVDFNIPMTCRDDLLKHRGVYALIDQPQNLNVGDHIRFIVSDTTFEEGIITDIEKPGESKREDMRKDFHSWWKIHYDYDQTSS